MKRSRYTEEKIIRAINHQAYLPGLWHDEISPSEWCYFRGKVKTERQILLKERQLNLEGIIQARGALWVSTRGAKMSGHALYYSVTRISEELLGSPMNPHLLRDCAASAISSDAPENIMAASRILGHSNIKTTLDHYEQSSMLAAGENLIESIEQRKILTLSRAAATA